MSSVIVVVLLCLLGKTSGDGGLNVKVDKSNGGFELSMSGTPWFSGAGVWARNDNKWYSTQDQTLILKKVSIQMIREDTGPVELTTFNWMSTDKSFSFSTYIKVNTEQSNVIVFGQVWDNGGKNTSCSNETGFISLWPTFKPLNLGKTGYMTYSGNFAAFMKFGSFNTTTPVYSNIDGGFPLTVFDNKMENTLVISPLDTFMSASMASYIPSGSKVPIFGLGIVSDVTSVPKGYTMESVIVAGHNVTGTMAKLGKLLRTKYKKDETYKQRDLSINYLGYWTDNGGCYYYNTGKYKNYEETILAVKKASVDNKIPYKYLQLDSWWYYKGMADGVKNWTTNTSVLPNGVKQLSDITGWDIVGHNRYWSNDTDYAKQNGGKFDFILDTNGYAVPIDTHFWKYLLSTAKKDLNLIVYEQDWLDREYEHVNELRSVLNLGETWLNQMGQAALDLGLTIQYCMPWNRHILQSVMNSAVTQIRVSDDYQPGNGQWQVGDTTILSHAMGVASFKDTFHSLVTESNCKFMNPEPYPELETYVSVLTGGPIGPSDTADHFNKTLIMSTCMSDGLLLKPTRPAMSLEETFLYRAFGTGGPDGVITVAYTEVCQILYNNNNNRLIIN